MNVHSAHTKCTGGKELSWHWWEESTHKKDKEPPTSTPLQGKKATEAVVLSLTYVLESQSYVCARMCT